MMSNKIRRMYQEGFSLLDAIFALVIIAVITLATVTYFRQAEHQVQITALLSEIKGILQAAEEYNDENGSFADIDMRDIAKKRYVVPRYNIVLPFKGKYYLAHPWTGLSPNGGIIAGIWVQAHPGDSSRLDIMIGHLPSFACGQVLGQLNQFMNISDIDQSGKTPSDFANIQDYCVWQNTRDKFTTLGIDYLLTYPKK